MVSPPCMEHCTSSTLVRRVRELRFGEDEARCVRRLCNLPRSTRGAPVARGWRSIRARAADTEPVLPPVALTRPCVSVGIAAPVAFVRHDRHRPVHPRPVLGVHHVRRGLCARGPYSRDAVHVLRTRKEPRSATCVDHARLAVVYQIFATDDGIALGVVVWVARANFADAVAS